MAVSDKYNKIGAAYRSKFGEYQTEVGDVAAGTFSPQFKLKRWGGEHFLSFVLSQAGLTGQISTTESGDSIVWSKGNATVRFYDKGGFAEGGGFEFEVELASKPATNSITFTIVHDGGLEFVFQPPLANVNADGSTWAVGPLGRSDRPALASGSYAVYATGKKNGVYKTGKVTHIHRPFAVDSLGARVWCTLTITPATATTATATLTCPQAFLDTATYPVIIDPTFGYTTQGASTVLLDSNAAAVALVGASDRYLATTGDVITSFSVYGNSNSGTQTASCAAYTFPVGVPVARLAAGTTISFTTTPGWRTSAGVSQSLTAGTVYVVAAGAYPAPANSVTLFYDSTAGAASLQTTSTLGASWTEASMDVFRVSMYATYTAALTEQEGFRWRNDDGSESTATWLATQDTGITQPTGTNTRLRTIMNTTNDEPSESYQLEYRKVGNTDWHKVN